MKRSILLTVGILLFVGFCGVAVSGMSAPSENEVTITGTISADNQLIDEKGQSYQLAETEQGVKVRAMIGKKVEVKGTLLEGKEPNVVRITEYKVLQPKEIPAPGK